MYLNVDVSLTVHLSIFISVINQLDAQNFNYWDKYIYLSIYIYIYIHTHIYKHNMISVTLNTSVTNLTFTINSRKSKSEIATTCVCSLLTEKDTQEIWSGARNVYLWLPHLLTPVRETNKVLAISSVISVARYRWYMFLSFPLKLQRNTEWAWVLGAVKY